MIHVRGVFHQLQSVLICPSEDHLGAYLTKSPGVGLFLMVRMEYLSLPRLRAGGFSGTVEVFTRIGVLDMVALIVRVFSEEPSLVLLSSGTLKCQRLFGLRRACQEGVAVGLSDCVGPLGHSGLLAERLATKGDNGTDGNVGETHVGMVWWEGCKEIERFKVDVRNYLKSGKRRGLYI